MAIQEIGIDTSLLATDIKNLSEALETARNQSDLMYQDLEELDMMWDGPANEEFMKQYTIDRQNAENMFATVQSIIECMEYAKKQYEACDSEVGDIINAM